MWICKRARFDAAHWLPNYEGLCRHLHGHTYTVEVHLMVEGVDEKTRMGVDFRELSRFLEDEILGKFDHSCLNDFIEQPTAEAVCQHFLDIAEKRFKGVGTSVVIRVYETPDSWVEDLRWLFVEEETQEEDADTVLGQAT